MKDQYFGDVSDFVKYGALRRFSRSGLRVFVSWMLTAPDVRTDGRHVDYLQHPDRYRRFDPDMFDAIAGAIAAGRRSVAAAQDLDLVPGARYQEALLRDDMGSRQAYFDRLVGSCRSSDLVFLDPDNGLEVPSTRVGRRGSSKYVYWDEVTRLHQLEVSLVVYQHFPRIDRTQYLDRLCASVRERVGAAVLVLRAPRVAFVVIPAARHRENLTAEALAIAEDWSPLLAIHDSR